MQEIKNALHPPDNPCAFAISQIDCRDIQLVKLTNPYWFMVNFVAFCDKLGMNAYMDETSNVGTFAYISPLPLSIKDLRVPVADAGFAVSIAQEESDYKLLHENCIIVLTALQYAMGYLTVRLNSVSVEYVNKSFASVILRVSWI